MRLSVKTKNQSKLLKRKLSIQRTKNFPLGRNLNEAFQQAWPRHELNSHQEQVVPTESQKGPSVPRTRCSGIPGKPCVPRSLPTQTASLPSCPRAPQVFPQGEHRFHLRCYPEPPSRQEKPSNPPWARAALLCPVQRTPAAPECLHVCSSVSAAFLQYLNPTAVLESAFLYPFGWETDLLDDVLTRSSSCQHHLLSPANRLPRVRVAPFGVYLCKQPNVPNSSDPKDGGPLTTRSRPLGEARATAGAAAGWQGLHSPPTPLPENRLFPGSLPQQGHLCVPSPLCSGLSAPPKKAFPSRTPNPLQQQPQHSALRRNRDAAKGHRHHPGTRPPYASNGTDKRNRDVSREK